MLAGKGSTMTKEWIPARMQFLATSAPRPEQPTNKAFEAIMRRCASCPMTYSWREYNFSSTTRKKGEPCENYASLNRSRMHNAATRRQSKKPLRRVIQVVIVVPSVVAEASIGVASSDAIVFCRFDGGVEEDILNY